MKDNQPKLKQAIQRKLAPAMFALQDQPAAKVRREHGAVDHARQHHKGHGRIECRDILTLPVEAGELDWPHAAQIAMVQRRRQVGDRPASIEYASFVCSLPREQADARFMLELTRGHWSIENGLFHVRDVTFGEDACRVRSEHAPQNLAAIRNAAITLLNDAGHRNKAAAQRRFAAHPHEALALIRGP